MKDESYYRKVVLEQAYTLVKAKLMKELDSSESISFTSDIWSGPKESFIRFNKL